MGIDKADGMLIDNLHTGTHPLFSSLRYSSYSSKVPRRVRTLSIGITYLRFVDPRYPLQVLSGNWTSWPRRSTGRLHSL